MLGVVAGKHPLLQVSWTIFSHCFPSKIIAQNYSTGPAAFLAPFVPYSVPFHRLRYKILPFFRYQNTLVLPSSSSNPALLPRVFGRGTGRRSRSRSRSSSPRWPPPSSRPQCPGRPDELRGGWREGLGGVGSYIY